MDTLVSLTRTLTLTARSHIFEWWGFEVSAPPYFSGIDNDPTAQCRAAPEERLHQQPLHPGTLAGCNWPSLAFSGRPPSATPENPY